MDWGVISVLSIILYVIYILNPIKKWTVKVPTCANIYRFYYLIFIIGLIATFSRMKAIKLFFQEQITLTQVIGCFIIIIGILYHNILKFIHNKFKYHSLHQYSTV